jgi:hypothetical protein
LHQPLWVLGRVLVRVLVWVRVRVWVLVASMQTQAICNPSTTLRWKRWHSAYEPRWSYTLAVMALARCAF